MESETEIINVACPKHHESNVIIEDCSEIQDDIIVSNEEFNGKSDYIAENTNQDDTIVTSHFNLESLMERENDESNESDHEEENNEHDDLMNQSIEKEPDEQEVTQTTEPERKKRGIPKTFLANQRKYLEALEKQQKMLNSRKDKKKSQPVKKNKNSTKQTEIDNTNKTGTRRVIVAGKVKYLPIHNVDKTSNELKSNNITNTNEEMIDIPVVKKETKTVRVVANKTLVAPTKVIKSNSKTSRPMENNINQNDESEKPKRVPSSIAKKMEIHKAVMAKQNNLIKRKPNSNGSNKKIPSKYAKQIENDVKKQTIKNVKNFADLRRVKAMQDINPDTDIDANKASIIELRKLKIEQRKKEQAEMKKRAEANKRESKIQEILRNDKMSKFSKTLAIKNLSVTSRNGRNAIKKNKLSEKQSSKENL